MTALLKPILLALETAVLIGPLSILLCYSTVLTLLVGIPASIVQVFDTQAAFEPLMLVSALGNLAGDFALLMLWSLAYNTIRQRRFIFSPYFRLGLASGALAAICLSVIYGWPALLFGALPPTILALHFSYLQTRPVMAN